MSAVSEYRTWCDVRPSEQQIGQYLHELASSQRLSTKVVVADMYIDQACVSQGRAEESIVAAEHVLSQVIDQVYEIDEQEDSLEAIKHVSAWAVRALLRHAELPSWQEAVTGELITNRYGQLLYAAYQAEYFRYGDTKADSQLVEFMPILLGSRGLERGGVGWLGRLALEREEQGLYNNWDVGMIADDQPTSYMDPPYRIGLKTSKNRGSGRNAPSDAIRMVAHSYKFDDVSALIASCLHERGQLPKVMDGEHLYTPAELDAITVALAEQVVTVTSPPT